MADTPNAGELSANQNPSSSSRRSSRAVDQAAMAARRAGSEANTLADKVSDNAHRIKWLVIALLVLFAAAAALYSWARNSSIKRTNDAQNAVFKAAIEVQGKPEADALAVFGKAANDFRGLTAGQQARIYQFSYAFNTGKFADAEKAARDFLKEYPGSVMANRAALALGQSLVQQDKLDEAVTTFQSLAAKNDPATVAEAKLALAQTLEKNALLAQDDPAEYRRRLEAAEAEYTDIISRSAVTIPSQRGYWPQEIRIPADYALVQIKDKLAGHNHPEPRGPEEPQITERDLESAQGIRPPSADNEETAPAEAADANADAEEETPASGAAGAAALEEVQEELDTAADAASEAAQEAADTAEEAAQNAEAVIEEAAQAAEEAVDAAKEATGTE